MSLEGWLSARRTVKAMGLVLEHSKMTTLAVELLEKCIRDGIGGKQDDLQKSFALLEQKEHEADDLRKRFIEELAKGELPADERVGLMRLGRQIDWITDWSHEAGRILVLFDLSPMPKQVQDVIVEMCETVKEYTVTVADSVEEVKKGDFEKTHRDGDGVSRPVGE